jgi:hypothetical protein
VKLKSVFIALCILFAILSFRNHNELKPARILHQMYDSIKNIKTLRKKISAIERIDNKYIKANSEIKLHVNPRRLYFINREKKLEVLYNPEPGSKKAFVKPHTFPYLTLTLDPLGNIMRKNQHYTLNELGFEYIGKSVALTLNKDKEGINNFVYHGKHVKNGYNCYFLEYENKTFGYTTYTVGDKETCTSISYKLCLNDYLIRDKNELHNDFGYLKKGRKLLVPTLYCKRAILYIDDKLMLPVSISLYDDAGLLESYEYTGVEVNKPIKPEEFTRSYKDYHF